MTIKGLLATAAGVAMMTTSTVAVAAPTAPVASTATRAGTDTAHDSDIGASIATTTLISVGILAAIVVVLLVAVDNDDGNGGSPASP